MKWAKVLLIIAVPLLIMGLALGTAGIAMACPDGPTQIDSNGGIVAPSSGDSVITPTDAGSPPPAEAQTSTNTISFLIPVVAVAASVGGLAIAAFVLRKRIHRKISPRTCDLLPSPVEGSN
jgi:hypothetical protein